REPFRARVRGDVSVLDQNVESQRGRQIPAELLVTRRGRAELMIEVRQTHEGKGTGARELEQQMRQGNRIGATRDTDDDTGARRQQVLPPDRALNVLMET